MISVVVINLIIEYSFNCMSFGKFENSIDVKLYIEVSIFRWMVG